MDLEQLDEETNFKIFNTPKNLDLNKIFPTFSKEKLDKVRFLIHQCNYYSDKMGFNMHRKNLHWFLSLKLQDLCDIIKTLEEQKVIYLYSKGYKGKKASFYKIVTPFNYHKEETVNKHIFDINSIECPMWYQKYIADGGVRNAETTNWVKRPKDWKPQTNQISTVDKDAYIKLLEEFVTANGMELPEFNSIGLDMTGGHGKQSEPTMAIVPAEPEPAETPEAIFIRKGEKEGIITNYNIMAEWYETLSNEDRATIESYLLNGVGTSISYTLRKDYNAYFKREETEGMILITLKKVVKDFNDIVAA